MLTIDEIRQAIDQKAPGRWTAGDTSVWGRLGEGSARGLFGLKLSDNRGMMKTAADDFDALALPPPPTRIDWRSENGGKLAAIRDQGLDCGACVAFATIATVESQHWIDHGSLVELSEAELFHCNGGSCNDGWGLAAGISAATNGLVSRADGAWSSHPVCRGAAPVVRVTRYVQHTNAVARRRAVARGPVVGGMSVYEDLAAYTGGIYTHVTGAHSDDHAVCIVGYDDADQCWIARNSWGDGWGEGGYFRIAYGECEIDDHPFYSCKTQAA